MLNIFQWIVNGLESAAVAAVSLLPDSPFQTITLSQTSSNVLGYINYFVPVGQIVAFLSLFTAATAIWYGVRWILRFSKFVE